jgi:O-antigen/teichoic acid export membrane protein
MRNVKRYRVGVSSPDMSGAAGLDLNSTKSTVQAAPEPHSLRRSTAIVASANMLLTIVNAGSGVVAARILGASGRGVLAAAQSIGGLVAVLVTLGLAEAVVFHSARHPATAGQALTTAFVLALAACLVIIPVSWLVIGSMHLSASARPATLAYTLMGVVFALGFPAAVFRGVGRTNVWTAMRFISPVLWLASISASVLFGRSPVRIVGLFLALQLPFLCGAWLFAVNQRLVSRPSLSERAKPMLRYGFPLLLSSVPALVSLRLDQVLLATRVSSSRLGVYAAAAALSSAAVPLVGAVGNVMFPAVARRAKSSGVAFVAPILRQAVLLSIALCTCLAAASAVALPIVFGSEFASGRTPAVILSAAAVFLCISAVQSEILRGLSKSRAVLWAEVAGAVTTIAGLLAMLTPLGLNGAAFASCAGYATTAMVQLLCLSRASGLTLGELVAPRFSDLRDMFHRSIGVARSM